MTNNSQMNAKRSEVIPDEQKMTKCMPDNTTKINSNLPDNYKKLVKFLRKSNIIHNTFQLKEERAFGIVIKYLHHTTVWCRYVQIEYELSKKRTQCEISLTEDNTSPKAH